MERGEYILDGGSSQDVCNAKFDGSTSSDDGLGMPIRCITSSSTGGGTTAQRRRILVNMPLFLPNMHDAVKAIIRGGAELQGMQFPNPFHTLDFLLTSGY